MFFSTMRNLVSKSIEQLNPNNMEALCNDIRVIISSYLFDYRYTEVKNQYFQFIHSMLKADADNGTYFGPIIAKQLFNWRPLSRRDYYDLSDNCIFRLTNGLRKRTVHKLSINY